MKRTILQLAAAPAALLIVGFISLWARQPFLTASLGSAILVQVLEFDQQNARPWSIAAGQVAGVIGGFAGLYVAGAFAAPPFLADNPLVGSRILATVVAIAITLALQLAIKAKSAPGGAIALIVCLGIDKPNWSSVVHLVVGVLLITAVGEIARRATVAA